MPKNPKKHHPHNNKQNKGPKPSQATTPLNVDNQTKWKSKKTERHCKLCEKDDNLESKCFKKTKSLGAIMKKHNIDLDFSISATSHMHALSALVFSFNASYSSSSNEWIIDSRASYCMAKNKAIFFAQNDCNTKHIFFWWWLIS